MKVAGVSINEENIPSRDTVFKMALNTFEYKDDPLREDKINKLLDATKLWVKESKSVIKKEDGLHTTITKKPTKRK